MNDSSAAPQDPHRLAGQLLRALRAYAGLSQRELAERAGVPLSTISSAEGPAGRSPSWTSMVRAAAACGCSLSIVAVSADGNALGPWQFDGVRDLGARHLPAHLEVWRLTHASEWSSFHKYSCYANPPIPPFSYRLRSKR